MKSITTFINESVAAHLTNGMKQTSDEPTTKEKAAAIAKSLRGKGVYASIFPDNGKYTVWVGK